MIKKNFIPLALAVTGLVFILLPYHIEFSGYVLILLGAGIYVRRFLKKGLRIALTAAMITCSAVLLAAMGYIAFYGSWNAAPANPDYAVILGAQVHGDKPSRVLRERLDRGLVYMEENPDTVIIVSGGLGDGEHHSEARVMYDYLQSRGADMSRVHMEDRSTNTRENLIYSGRIAESLGLDKTSLTLITSEYHLCRAEYIGGTLGLSPGGVGAETGAKFLLVNYYVREVFSFVKAFAQAGAGG